MSATRGPAQAAVRGIGAFFLRRGGGAASVALGGGLGWASARCLPIPRKLWPPVLLHGGPADQVALIMRPPGNDYSAVYASSSIADPIKFGRIYEGGRPWIGDKVLDRPGDLYVIVPHLLPLDTAIYRGSQEDEWVIAACAGTVAAQSRHNWRAVERLLDEQRALPGAPRTTKYLSGKVPVTVWLEDFFGYAESASRDVLSVAATARALKLSTQEYSEMVCRRASRYQCNMRVRGQGKVVKVGRLQAAACAQAQRGGSE